VHVQLKLGVEVPVAVDTKNLQFFDKAVALRFGSACALAVADAER
jgi:hypothetical protein